MASDSKGLISPDGTDELLRSLVRGGRGEALRAQLSARYHNSPADAIEEAIQYACKSFMDEAEGITAPGQVYAWIRTAALRSLGREADRSHREVAVDPIEDGLDRIGAEDAGPVEELIALEDDADLEMLVGEVAASRSFHSSGPASRSGITAGPRFIARRKRPLINPTVMLGSPFPPTVILISTGSPISPRRAARVSSKLRFKIEGR